MSGSNGYDCFDELIRQLRADGYSEAAEQLDSLLHHTAWTTGTELIGELGLTIRDFLRTKPTTTPEMRQRLKECQMVVRRVWAANGAGKQAQKSPSNLQAL